MSGPRASAGGTSFTAPLLIERNTLSSAATTTTIEVSGTATFAGDLNVAGTVSADSITGGINITGTTNLATLTVSGAAGFNSLSVSGGGRFNSINVTGNTTLANVTVSGASKFSTVQASGAANFNAITVTGIANFGDHVIVSATAEFREAVFNNSVGNGSSSRAYGIFGWNSNAALIAANHSAANPVILGAIPGESAIMSITAWATPGSEIEVSASATMKIMFSAVGISSLTHLSRTSGLNLAGNNIIQCGPTSSRTWLPTETNGAMGEINGVSGDVTILGIVSAVGTQPTGGVWRFGITYGHRGSRIT